MLLRAVLDCLSQGTKQKNSQLVSISASLSSTVFFQLDKGEPRAPFANSSWLSSLIDNW